LLVAALARAAFTAAGWRPPPLSPVVVRPLAPTITGFTVDVISLANGVTMALMAVLLGWRGVLFVSAVSIRDGMFREDVRQSLARTWLKCFALFSGANSISSVGEPDCCRREDTRAAGDGGPRVGDDRLWRRWPSAVFRIS
jgi:hypothetical protein